MSNNGEIYCKLCLKKNSPVYTILIVGENISEYRFSTGKFYCNDCYKVKQKSSYNARKGTFAKDLLEEEEIQLEELEQQWNDPEFKSMKELSDKVVAVWNKFGRRIPKRGLVKDIICSIIFKDMWNLTADVVIKDLLDSRNDTATIRMRHKEVLFLYIPSVIDAFRESYREKARNRWENLVTAINNKYAGKEKLVAKPEYESEISGKLENRYFLLSYEEELKSRDGMHVATKNQIDHIMDVESGIVKEHEGKQEQEMIEEESESQDEKKNGGE